MHLEACDIVRDWLDGPNGLNSRLSRVPTKDGVTLRPVDRFVVRDTDAAIAAGRYPDVARLVVVDVPTAYSVDAKAPIGVCQTSDLQLAVTYIVRNADVVSARRETGYVLRCLRQCLLDLQRSADSLELSSQGVVIMGGNGVKMVPFNEAAENCTLMGGLIAALQVRDTINLSLP
jgi:hypothetical protein